MATKKYNAVYEDLYKQISEGIYKDGSKLPSEMQLMATYGVSRQTIRLALDQLAAHAVIRKVHGSGSYVQFAPPKQKTNQIAVLVYDFQESVFPSIRGKVEETLFQQGYVTVVVSTLGEIDKERQILQRFCENHVDGIILQPEYSSLVSPNLDLIQTLRSLGTKLVFMDSRYPDMSLQDIPCVSMENYSAAYNITIELIRSGHSKEPLNNRLYLVSPQCISRHLRLAEVISAQNSHYLSTFLLCFPKKGRLPLCQVVESFRPAIASAYKLAQANIAYSRFSFFLSPRYTVFL